MNKKSCIRKTLYIIIVLILSFIFITGCGVTKIELSQKAFSLQNGDSYQLTIKGPSNVIYKSSNPNIVFVNEETGYIEAKYPGTATITIYEKGNESNKEECVITVTGSSEVVNKDHILTFDPNGGTVSVTTKTIANGSTFGELPIPTREGYKFVGWYSKADGGNKVSANTVMIADKTVYAHWEEIVAPPTPTVTQYTLTLDPNGGTVSPTTKTLNNGDKYGSLPTPTRDGYKFKGWYTKASGGSRVSDSTIISKNTKIYAQWIDNKPVKITKIDFRNQAVKAYFNDSSRKIINICKTYSCNSKLVCDDPVSYKSSITDNVKIYSYNEKTREKKYIKKVANSNLKYNLLPGNTYYLESESKKTNNEYVKVEMGVRMLDVPGVRNVRDLGGWKADGGTIKYGRLYRSANPNGGDDNTSKALKQIGINLIVDLRGKVGDKKPVNYTGLEHKYISVGPYSVNAKNIRNAVNEIMKSVVGGKNILFHCQIGTDRTGTVAFLLEGILGVSLNNLLDDYELSSFYLYKGITNRVRTYSSIRSLYNTLNKYGSTDQEKFINWFIGTSKDKANDLKIINNYRKAMINGTPKEYKLSGNKAVPK